MRTEISTTEIQQKEQLARFLWTGFILMFFAVQAIIWTIAILMTSNDSSHAVVRDFEAKAALPPSRAERSDSNRAIGWTASLKVLSASSKQTGTNQSGSRSGRLPEITAPTLSLNPRSTPQAGNKQVGTKGLVEVELTLTDKNGSPIELPVVDLTAFHCARAAEVQPIKLSPHQPGVYRGMMQLYKSGQWQFDGTIRREKETFYFSHRLSL